MFAFIHLVCLNNSLLIQRLLLHLACGHKANMCTGLEAGLFKWSMRHQDGTQPSEAARELPEEDRRFLELAMEEYSQARPAPMRCYPQQGPTLSL